MTNEEKARAYDEALKDMRVIYPNLRGDAKLAVEHAFPELAESEDEKIRKFICSIIDNLEPKDFVGVKKMNVLAWLEKQKENTWSEEDDAKVKTMCKEGDLKPSERAWLMDLKNRVWKEPQHAVRVTKGFGDPDGPQFELVDLPEEQKPTENISRLTVKGKGVYKICPRCKERMVRDDSMVYTSMPPQYGYKCPKCGEMEFDTAMYDNPEMEEQKPVEKQDYSSLNDTEKAIHRGFLAAGAENVPVTIIKETAKECLAQMKPEEWSEEDKKTLDAACCWIAEYAGYLMDKNYGKASMLMSLTEKLKSLSPQPKQNDMITPNKEFFQWIYDRLVNVHKEDPNVDYMISFKKRIEESSWKPSEEQIYSLGTVVKGYNECAVGSIGYHLKELYEHLKKL